MWTYIHYIKQSTRCEACILKSRQMANQRYHIIRTENLPTLKFYLFISSLDQIRSIPTLCISLMSSSYIFQLIYKYFYPQIFFFSLLFLFLYFLLFSLKLSQTIINTTPSVPAKMTHFLADTRFYELLFNVFNWRDKEIERKMNILIGVIKSGWV